MNQDGPSLIIRATGGYICGCGRPSNLVLDGFEPPALIQTRPLFKPRPLFCHIQYIYMLKMGQLSVGLIELHFSPLSRQRSARIRISSYSHSLSLSIYIYKSMGDSPKKNIGTLIFVPLIALESPNLGTRSISPHFTSITGDFPQKFSIPRNNTAYKSIMVVLNSFKIPFYPKPFMCLCQSEEFCF